MSRSWRLAATVGDIESLPFLEAIRQLRKDVGRNNVLYMHVTLIPWIAVAGEMKTKPTQHSVKELRSIGIQPDLLLCRCDRPLVPGIQEKLSTFCDVSEPCVIQCPDAPSIYDVPLILEREGLAQQTLELLQLEARTPDLREWQVLVERMHAPKYKFTAAIVGKYTRLTDAYLSVTEALRHAAIAMQADFELRWVGSEDIEVTSAAEHLEGVDAIIVPGGFGNRGIAGKIQAIQYARAQKIPFLGLCLGMQCAIIEWGANVAGLAQANSAEFDPEAENLVIDLLPEQEDIVNLGGTMRLGLYPCRLAPNTLARKLYQQEVIYERHRHRYEFNNAYRNLFVDSGYAIGGISPDNRLVEAIELPDHPFFIATQFHPEFESRLNRPHPLYRGLVAAALERCGAIAEIQAENGSVLAFDGNPITGS